MNRQDTPPFLPVIRVFPDHMATGLWASNGRSVTPEEIGVKDPWFRIGLRYWVEIWEFKISRGEYSQEAIAQWNEDGKAIVMGLNSRYGKRYQFVYAVTEQTLQSEE